MIEFESIEGVADRLRDDLASRDGKNKVTALYAFNGTGKTRLASMLSKEGDDITFLRYSAFLEDMFTWDNESYTLAFNVDSWIIQLVIDQGLENDIIDNFKYATRSKIEPDFDFNKGKVKFRIASGDDKSESNIKISRSEESTFIWSIFFTVLKAAINELSVKEDDRSTSVFNSLQYVIIDDPVSSIDDTKIMATAITLTELVNVSAVVSLNFLIMTHHTLFFNVIVNTLKGDRGCEFRPFSLFLDDGRYRLQKEGDSPFSYHLSVKSLIQTAINTGTVEKYHFNLFRNLLEKTSNFLGYQKWGDCLTTDNKAEFIRLLHLYSHGRLSDLESKELHDSEKNVFKEVFDTFTRDFRWGEK